MGIINRNNIATVHHGGRKEQAYLQGEEGKRRRLWIPSPRRTGIALKLQPCSPQEPSARLLLHVLRVPRLLLTDLREESTRFLSLTLTRMRTRLSERLSLDATTFRVATA